MTCLNHQRCEGGPAETLEVVNPAIDEVVALVCCADTSDLDSALETSQAGFKLWSKTSPWERSRILNRCAHLIEERKPELARLMTLEQGKPLAESFGELDRTVDVFQWCAAEAVRTYGRLLPQRQSGYRQMTIKEPVGGVKDSGIGSEGGPEGFDAYCTTKFVSQCNLGA